MRRGTPNKRLRAGFIVIAIVLSVFGARLIQLQAVDPGSYAQMAAAESSEHIVLPATRGEITDRNGQPFAQSVAGTMIVADPTMTGKNASRLAAFLTRQLHLDYFQTLARLRTKNSRFVYVARQVPTARATAVVADADRKGWAGLFTNNDPLRVYPQKDVGANVVGFLGTPNQDGDAQPLAGLESSFNTYLSGKNGSARYEMGAGNEIPLGDNTTNPAVNGKNLKTTLDSNMQWYAQRVLQQTVRGAAAKSGVAIVMDSRTGQILALADYPTYDASNPRATSSRFYKSSALTDVYEPGSVEKVLTMSSLINSGLATDRTRLKVPGSIHVEDRIIHDDWAHGMMHLTLAGVLAKSSNVGTVLASGRIHTSLLHDYLTKFGLGQRTDIGIGGETKGVLPSPDQWTLGIKDRIAFGQSLDVNAIQEAAAINTIANHGVRVRPSLIMGSATADDGQSIGSDHATERRVVTHHTADEVTQMMERVVDPNAGVAPQAQVPGYVVAGKTGTAQEVGARCGCYNSTTVSFAGFAPADKPRFTVYVVVHSPRTGSSGAGTAGPAFSKLMSYALRRYGVAPTNAKPSKLPVQW